MQMIRIAYIVLSLVGIVGCGCGDTAPMRQLLLTETGDRSAPFEIDTSRLPPGAINRRTDRKDRCGNPMTELSVSSQHPVRVVLMPATRP